MTTLERRFISYFFPKRNSINILQHLTERCSKQFLMMTRFVNWFVLTILYIRSFNASQTIFTNIIYLTMNGYCMTYIYFALVSTNALIQMLFTGRVRVCSNYKYWVEGVFEIALSLQMPITLIYWILLFPFDLKMHSGFKLYLFALLHVVPIVCLLIDFRYSRYRFDRRRMLFPVFHSLVYSAINYEAYTLLHKPVYPILTWRDLESLINFSLAIAIALTSHWYCRKLKTPKQIKDNMKKAS